MLLSIVEEQLQIEFTWKEQLFAVRFHKLWQIPLTNIAEVTTAKPQSNWKEIRAPGSFIPGIIKAGTYYTDKGKEFWYVNKDSNYLNIELQDESYKRIILTVDNNDYWQQQLTQLC
jgi:ssDNA-binding replication factor A large subunit